MARRDAGQAYLDKIVAHLPEAEREELKKKLSVDAVLDELGDGTMMRSDYSKGQDELKEEREKVEADRQRLNKWYEDRKVYLEDYEKIKPEYDELKKAKPGDTPPPPVPKDNEELAKLRKKLEETEEAMKREVMAAPALMSTLIRLGNRHREEFKEELDPDLVINEANKKGVRVVDAYEEMFRERREKLSKERREEELKAAEKRGYDRHLQEVRSQLPHVVDTQEPSTLEGLKAAKAGESKRIESLKAAVDSHYDGSWKQHEQGGNAGV